MQCGLVYVPYLPREETLEHIVFRRPTLSSLYRSSVTVLFDARNQSQSKPTHNRIKCALCSGTAKNRGICVHENEVLKYMTLSNTL